MSRMSLSRFATFASAAAVTLLTACVVAPPPARSQPAPPPPPAAGGSLEHQARLACRDVAGRANLQVVDLGDLHPVGNTNVEIGMRVRDAYGPARRVCMFNPTTGNAVLRQE